VWTIYQRIILRLPYRIITQVMEHLFGVGMSQATIVNFLRYVASYYKVTEAAILQAILKSEFVHVDETRINIQGVDQYVWVFTDGRHVAFRMTLMFGLLPAVRLGTLNVDVLKDAGRSASAAPEQHRTRNVLVVAQVALALVLLIVSGLMIRTFVAMRHVEPGFVRPVEVQTFHVRVHQPSSAIRKLWRARTKRSPSA
jgi:hypothetical protein